jgi:hypothetical protein
LRKAEQNLIFQKNSKKRRVLVPEIGLKAKRRNTLCASGYVTP